MNDANNPAAGGVCLMLPEKAYTKLSQLRDHLGLLAQISFVTTRQENEEPLAIRRAELGFLFEMAAVQIDEALLATQHVRTRAARVAE